MPVIIRADTQTHIQVIRALFNEYGDSLDFNLDFQDFDRELARLPGGYAPPDGGLWIATEGEQIIGCVGIRKLAPRICEMKRMYVRPGFRRRGVGRRLAEAAVVQARRIGYRCMRLDTIASMAPARALYRSLGFVEIEPYCFNPIPGAVFMEKNLMEDP